MLVEPGGGVLPEVEENLGIGERSARTGVGGYGPDVDDGLAGAANQEQRPDFAFAGDGAARDDSEAGSGGEGGRGDEADVCGFGVRAREREALGALGGHHPFDAVPVGQSGLLGFVFEVPHERGGIEEADCGDFEFGARTSVTHLFRVPSLTPGAPHLDFLMWEPQKL